ncbi:hypothetical protein QP028_04825 [Corynebacterium suedekumii]|nr:hypothetical protein QP028_04825 [Corynebacterium suedekumii]
MDLLQAVLITALVFTVPGAALAWVSGLRLPWALASSIPVSFGTFWAGRLAARRHRLALRHPLLPAHLRRPVPPGRRVAARVHPRRTTSAPSGSGSRV